MARIPKTLVTCWKPLEVSIPPCTNPRDWMILNPAQYIQGMSLPKISLGHRECMEAPFTSREIIAAIKSTKMGSAPGPGGFLALYYRKFQDFLVPHLTQYFNALWDGATLDPFLSYDIYIGYSKT